MHNSETKKHSLTRILVSFVYFFIMYSVHGLIVEFSNKLNFHTMLTEHFVCDVVVKLVSKGLFTWRWVTPNR